MSPDSLSLDLELSRFAHYAALTLLFGGLLFPVYAYRGQERAAGAARQTGGLIAAGVLALLSGMGWLAFTAAGMAGSSAAAWSGPVLLEVLRETDFGRLWIGRMAALAGVVVLVALRAGALRALALVAAAGALASLAWTGHANADEGVLGAVHRLADAAHLLTAGVWIGALPPLAAQLRRRPAGVRDDTSSFEMVSRFSRVAIFAVALLVLSGAANAALIMSSPADLATTAYGRLLCLKLLMVAGMLALAAVNRLRLTPALREDAEGAAARRLRRHCLVELGLGLGVLAVVAVLGTLSPG